MLMKIRRAQNDNQTYIPPANEDIPNTTLEIFEHIFIIFTSKMESANKSDLNAFLSIASKAKARYGGVGMGPSMINISQSNNALIEQAIINQQDYSVIELVTLVSYFGALDYVPKQLIAKINDIESLITVPNTSINDMLSVLIKNKYSEKVEVYSKLINQLKLTSTNMNANDVADIIAHIAHLSSLNILETDESIKTKFKKEFTPFFLNKLNDVIRRKAEQTGVSICLCLTLF